MEIIERLEHLPGWTEYRRVISKEHGPLRMKTMFPIHKDFWSMWKTPSIKMEMEKAGYTLRKVQDGRWIAFRLLAWIGETAKQRLEEESRAGSANVELIRPVGLEYLPFQKAGVKYAVERLKGLNGQRERDAILIADVPGLGKEQDVDTPTLTPTGWRRIGDLVAGDKIINADGTASTVTGVFPQGVKAIYKVKFSDGTETNSGLEHLWEVRDGNMQVRERGWSARTLGEIVRRGVLDKSGKGKWEIPQFPGHMETHGEAPTVDGWLLGQLIGNGSTGAKDGEIQVSTNLLDQDVIARLESLGGKTRITTCAQTMFSIERCGRIMDELRKLNLNCKSKEKSLHESLLVAPWGYRTELLKGLMDSDGSNARNRITFHTCSSKLAEGVAQLVRSLGGCAIVREYDRTHEGKPTEWQVNVRTPFCPFWSQRKSKGWKADPRKRGNKIVAVTYSHDAEAVCIMVDHPRHLYVTENYKLTHNTIQAIGIANQDPRLQELKILVVCPASLKKNWQNEMRKWLVDGIGHNVAIVKNRWPDQFNNAFIVNYDVLEKWQREIRETEWDLVIYDEAHYMKNEDARRTVFAMGGVVKGKKEPGMEEEDRPMVIVQPIKARKTVFLTGTPMENGRAKELWPMIQKCDPDGLGRSKRKFIERYGLTDDNFEELQQVMRTMFMVRRMKEDVLKDLPPKIRSVMSLDPDEWGVKALFDEEMRIFKEYKEAIRSWGVQAEMAKLGGKAHYKEVIKSKKAKLGLTLGDMARMRKEGAIAKVPGFMQQVMVKIEEGKKPLLFAHHKAVLSRIEEACKEEGLRVGRIDGDVPPERRQGLVDQFQRGELDVMVLGIIPAGVGLTLTASDTVMFCELDWIPGRMGQCEDRAHRIGQKDTVWVFHVVMEGSLDELMAKRLVEKQDRIERALDSLAEWDEDEEDDNEHAAIEAAAGAPSSKGYSVDKIEKDAERMSKDCYDAAVAAIRLIAGGASGFGSIDVEICQKILDRGETIDRNAAALGRKIAMRNKWALDEEITKHMEFATTKEKA